MKIKKLMFTPQAIIAIGFTSYLLVSYKGEIINKIKDYDNLGKSKEAVEFDSGIVVEENPTIIVENLVEEEPIVETEEVIEEEVPEIKEEISDDLFTSGYEFKDINFDEYKEINQDICGYVTIDGTRIDAPVMLNNNKKDDDGIDYYLHHDMNGNKCSKGEVYVDNNNVSFEEPMYNLSDVSIIYGHHMSLGRVFADICNFKTQGYVDEHPFAVIYTPEGYAYKAEFVGGILVDGNDTSIYHDNFEIEDEFNEFINNIKDNSYFTSDVDLEYGDKLVGFVTCSYEHGINGNLRYVLYAKLTKEYTNQKQIDEMEENNVSNYVR